MHVYVHVHVCACAHGCTHMQVCICVYVLEAVVQSREAVPGGGGQGAWKPLLCVKETTRSVVFREGL